MDSTHMKYTREGIVQKNKDLGMSTLDKEIVNELGGPDLRTLRPCRVVIIAFLPSSLRSRTRTSGSR